MPVTTAIATIVEMDAHRVRHPQDMSTVIEIRVVHSGDCLQVAKDG